MKISYRNHHAERRCSSVRLEGVVMKSLKKILHVDDDEDVILITKIALSTFGEFDALSCMSGPEAIAKAPIFMPDLFLLDSIMPGMDGEETLHELKKIPGLQHVPAIFMTVRAQASVAEILMDNGALGVITKPFDPVELQSIIQGIWDQGNISSGNHRNDSIHFPGGRRERVRFDAESGCFLREAQYKGLAEKVARP